MGRTIRTRARARIATLFVATAAVVVCATQLVAHDLFLKPEAFFVQPNGAVLVHVLNGTFTTSEGGVARDRLRDLSVASPSGVTHPDTSSWQASEKSSAWRIPVGAPGTYVLGASVRPRTLRLEAKDFNAYLREDGIPEVLERRRSRGELDRPAWERYSKHVKSLVQVGDLRSGADVVGTAFGHPAELVPLDNPYALARGGVLRVRALVDGAPVPGQLVLAGGQTTAGKRIPERGVRTDQQGVARVPLHQQGVWYVKFIRMQPVTQAGDSVDYESKWATLTFAVR